MSKIRTKKDLKNEIDKLTLQDKKMPLKKSFNLKDYDRIDEIIKSSNIFENMKKYMDACYKRRKKQYIFIQLLGLIIIITICAYIYTHNFVSSSELIYPTAWTLIILSYLLMDFFAYKRSLKLYGNVLDLSKSFKKKKTK